MTTVTGTGYIDIGYYVQTQQEISSLQAAVALLSGNIIDFSEQSGNQIIIPDGESDALTIKDGISDYVVYDSNLEKVFYHKPLCGTDIDVSDELKITMSGLDKIILQDSHINFCSTLPNTNHITFPNTTTQAFKLKTKSGDQDYMTIDTDLPLMTSHENALFEKKIITGTAAVNKIVMQNADMSFCGTVSNENHITMVDNLAKALVFQSKDTLIPYLEFDTAARLVTFGEDANKVDVKIDGDLEVTGSITSTVPLATINCVLELCDGVTSGDTRDMGVYGIYFDGLTEKTSGIQRDYNDLDTRSFAKWKLFTDFTGRPSNGDNFGATLASLEAYDFAASGKIYTGTQANNLIAIENAELSFCDPTIGNNRIKLIDNMDQALLMDTKGTNIPFMRVDTTTAARKVSFGDNTNKVDVLIDGDLEVTGTITSTVPLSTINCVVELCDGVTSGDTRDIGLYGIYFDGLTEKTSGFQRDYDDLDDRTFAKWKLFTDFTGRPSNGDNFGATLGSLELHDMRSTGKVYTGASANPLIAIENSELSFCDPNVNANVVRLVDNLDQALMFKTKTTNVPFLRFDTTTAARKVSLGDTINKVDVLIDGDLEVTGTITSTVPLSTINCVVELCDGVTSGDTRDIGLYGIYFDGLTEKTSGLERDYDDLDSRSFAKWKFFTDFTGRPTNGDNFGAILASIEAHDIRSGGKIYTGTSGSNLIAIEGSEMSFCNNVINSNHINVEDNLDQALIIRTKTTNDPLIRIDTLTGNRKILFGETLNKVDVVIDGDLEVTGAIIQNVPIATVNCVLELCDGVTSGDVRDMGFYGIYFDGATEKTSGLLRDFSSTDDRGLAKWKLFTDFTGRPSNGDDFDITGQLATLEAYDVIAEGRIITGTDNNEKITISGAELSFCGTSLAENKINLLDNTVDALTFQTKGTEIPIMTIDTTTGSRLVTFGDGTNDVNMVVNGTFISSNPVASIGCRLELCTDNEANTEDLTDSGFYMVYDDGALKSTGLIRDRNDADSQGFGTWRLFTDFPGRPANDTDFATNNTLASLKLFDLELDGSIRPTADPLDIFGNAKITGNLEVTGTIVNAGLGFGHVVGLGSGNTDDAEDSGIYAVYNTNKASGLIRDRNDNDSQGFPLWRLFTEFTGTPGTANDFATNSTLASLKLFDLKLGGAIRPIMDPLDIFGNTKITGNLEVTGTLINSGLDLGHLLELCSGNTDDAEDSGFYSVYNDGIAKSSGLIRDQNDMDSQGFATWRLFTEFAGTPTTTSDFSTNNTLASLKLHDLELSGAIRQTADPLDIFGNTKVTGNLEVTGTIINAGLGFGHVIGLCSGNTDDAEDSGFYTTYNTNKASGLIRDQDDLDDQGLPTWRLFTEYTGTPGTANDFITNNTLASLKVHELITNGSSVFGGGVRMASTVMNATGTIPSDTVIIYAGSGEREITNLTFTEAENTTSNNYNGVYWTFSTPITNYYVWYQRGGGIDPNPGGTGILVTLGLNDTTMNIATKTANAINSMITDAFVSVVASTITISNISDGNVTNASNGAFTPVPGSPVFNILTEGSTGGSITLTLPTLIDINNDGRIFHIIKTNESESSTVTIMSLSGQRINGALSDPFILTMQHEHVKLIGSRLMMSWYSI